MNKIKQLLSWNNYTISYFLVSILLVFSYYSVRSIMINQSPWFIVQASDLTLNVILLYGLVGLMIDKATKKMSKVKSWGIFLIAFIVLTAFFAIVGGFDVRWISD